MLILNHKNHSSDKSRAKFFELAHLLFSVFFLVVIDFSLTAQVSNNNIKDRTELVLDAHPLRSSTANSSVEWQCVNKSLTNKCLIYHNDQWFHFTPQKNGKFFLNISSQKCRDLQGVQVVVIEGNPCEVETYRILKCIPKIYQDNVFIELDSVQANTLYLVNIDGFLKDFCELDIQLSSKPSGLPLQSKHLNALRLKADVNQEIVQIQWHVDQSVHDQISHFELYRLKSGDVKSTLRSTLYTNNNSLGSYNEDYSYTDTLIVRGNYQYKVIGVEKESEDRLLLDQVSINSNGLPQKYKWIQIPLSFSKKGDLDISVINPYTDALLYAQTFEYIVPEIFSINLTKFVNQGIKRFWIKIRQVKTKEFRQYTYQINDLGDLVLFEKEKPPIERDGF